MAQRAIVDSSAVAAKRATKVRAALVSGQKKSRLHPRDHPYVKTAGITCGCMSSVAMQGEYIASQQWQETTRENALGSAPEGDSTMAYVHSATTARELITERKAAPVAPKLGFLGRLIAAMQAARMRQVEREIGLYLSRAGGKFSDENEREIERRFLSNSGW
jgi:hypothetical protein